MSLDVHPAFHAALRAICPPAMDDVLAEVHASNPILQVARYFDSQKTGPRPSAAMQAKERARRAVNDMRRARTDPRWPTPFWREAKRARLAVAAAIQLSTKESK